MPVTIRKASATPAPQSATHKKTIKRSGHTHPRQPVISLDQPGRLRVANLMAILNVSHSTLYAGIKSGRYPYPDGKDGSFPYWSTVTIKAFLDS